MINYSGALPPKTDVRDYKVEGTYLDLDEFKLDKLPVVKDQKDVGSCVAHATSSILEWFNRQESNETYRLSTGFIYGMQGEVSKRTEPGMYLRDACKIVQKYGDCKSKYVPYNIEMPECYDRLKEELSTELYLRAYIHAVKSYARCLTDGAIEHALFNYGPVLMSIRWYEDYTLDENSVVYFNTDSPSGCHAIMVYGFNSIGWLCQNSWGKSWGNGGRFILPFEYGYVEAWSFVDAENNDVHKPKRNVFLDVFYNLINSIINLFKGA